MHTSFDRALPGLAEVLDPAAVGRMFSTASMEVVHARRQDTKYAPGKRCVVSYSLSVREADNASRETMGAVAVTRDGIEHWLVVDDPALPGLAATLEPGAIAARLQELGLLSASSEGGDATPVRYRPGDRCVVRYHATATARRDTYYGKVFARDPLPIVELVERLRSSGELRPALHIGTVVHCADLRLVLTRAAEGPDLNDVAFAPDTAAERRASWFRGAGEALAALHSCRLPGAPRAGLADDVEALHQYRDIVAAVDTEMTRRYAHVLARLVDRVGSWRRDDEGEVAAGHGAFRLDQLMVVPSGFELIDLDSLCESVPARDFANLDAYLDWKVMRRADLAEPVSRARAMFRAGYAERRPYPDTEVLAVHRAASLLKIAGRRYRSLAIAEWPLVPALVDRAESLLAGRIPAG